MTNLNERIDKLKEDACDLRKEIKDLKETLQQQNELIISLLSKQSDVLHMDNSEDGFRAFSRIFPLDSVEDLEKYENEINDENKDYNINIIRNLLRPQGLLKNLGNILSSDVIMASNVDGHYNKKRLLNYSKFLDVLFNACYTDDNYTMPKFLGDFRRALRVAKNRCHKNNCMARQKLRCSERQLQEIVKTEEIFFD